MASCDVFSCVRHIFTSEEEYAIKAEKNAESLSVVFGSHVIETQCALEETLRTARTHLNALTSARAQNNAPAIARATANTMATAAKARDLRSRIDKYRQQQEACDRAVHGLREGRQMKKTVGTLAAVQRQFKVLQLGNLSDATERTMSDMMASNEELGDIRSIIGQNMEPPSADPDADIRELEELLLVETKSHVVMAPAPQLVESGPRTAVKLPSADEYMTALASGC